MAKDIFDVLQPASWSAEDQKTIDKYFKGKHAEWNKQTLAVLRKKLRKDLLELQSFTCAYCRRLISEDIGRNEIDHIVAKAIEGMARFTYERMNLVAACKRCNKNKGDHPVLQVAITASCSYPLKGSDFLWVHPYVHKYSEHFVIHDNYIFEAIGDNQHRRRAQAVIDQCKLMELSTVEKRRLYESTSQAEEAHFAIFSAIGQFPRLASEELARTLKESRPELSSLSEQTILDLIKGVRTFAVNAVENALKTFPTAEA